MSPQHALAPERRLLQWLSQENAPEQPIAIHAFPDTGRGAIAARDISANSIIVSIPLRLCITLASVRKSRIGPVLKGLSDIVSQAVFLLWEKQNPDSQYAAYFATLPAQFSTILDFTETELAELQDQSLVDEAIRMQQSRKEEFKQVVALCRQHPSLFSGGTVTFDDYCWGWLQLTTRGVYMSNEEPCVLVPLLDMLNHAEVDVKPQVSRDGTCFEIYTEQAISRGSQVFINYHRGADNAFLLQHYGFIIPNNENDYVPIPNSFPVSVIPDSDPARDMKQLLLQDPMYSQGLFISSTGECSAALQATLRIALSKGIISASRAYDQCSPAVERSVLNAIELFAIAQIRTFSTSISLDEHLLEQHSSELSLNTQNAVSLRLIRKRILAKAAVFPDQPDNALLDLAAYLPKCTYCGWKRHVQTVNKRN